MGLPNQCHLTSGYVASESCSKDKVDPFHYRRSICGWVGGQFSSLYEVRALRESQRYSVMKCRFSELPSILRFFIHDSVLRLRTWMDILYGNIWYNYDFIAKAPFQKLMTSSADSNASDKGPGCLMLSHCSGANYPLSPLSRWVVCLKAPLPGEMIRSTLASLDIVRQEPAQDLLQAKMPFVQAIWCWNTR